ncbi:MAG: 3-keto-5-aminohexanoate cleavage protein [Candidatus Omnitrophota bacterium]|nr:3-keto-5-aminohexanoate cleavage protein [Candidatus Omnitrophota bacterium]MDZ4242357.1 3-keto-5-aminohexanoate cleavage protein [Candidatus Omnitrophota bacterium]
MNKQFILNFTPTGMIPTKAMTPHVPILVPEIVEQVTEAAGQGANMAHVHARNPQDESPTYEKEIYADIIRGIRAKNKDLVICVSTSGRNFPEFEKRSACLDLTGDLKPDFGSLTLSSLNFNKQASINSPEMIQALAKKMLDNGIKPELEVFDLGMINYAHYLIQKGLIKPPYYFNLILGNIACAQANLLSLGLMIKELPPDSIWSVGGIGGAQLKMNAIGIIEGGGVRIGLEDNIYLDSERTHLATNSELVRRIIGIAKVMGRVPYSHREARKILGVA